RGEILSLLLCVLCVLCGELFFFFFFFFFGSSAVNSPHAQLVAEPYDRELLRARFAVDRHFEARPLARAVPRIHVLRVPVWLRRGPAAIGARGVTDRLAAPRLESSFPRGLLGPSVREATMVMDVVDERHAGRLAELEEVERPVDPVIVLDRE